MVDLLVWNLVLMGSKFEEVVVFFGIFWPFLVCFIACVKISWAR